jgi:hypothetical protein
MARLALFDVLPDDQAAGENTEALFGVVGQRKIGAFIVVYVQ